MLFSSLPFLLSFLPLFFIIYFVAKKRNVKNIILLIFSMIFYAWGEPFYIILMIFSILINHYFAVYINKNIENIENTKNAKTLLIFAIIINLALIGVFKYAGFFVNIFAGLFGVESVNINIPLPIGISFYTFQNLSYIIDVYHKKVKVQKNPLYFGAYVAAFPQLIAGPIVRYETIADELENRVENMYDFAAGLRRFTAGLAKKVLIANNIALMADGILTTTFNNGEIIASVKDHGAIGAWLAIIAYTLQIYYDFSGYSDMAIGIGRMIGFHYPENFNYPYIAKSVTDFWRRWHISLSSFFRDYIYIPLGGNRVKTIRWILNIVIVWGLTGLWHGAAWTFILWGLYFGVLLIIEKNFLQNNILKIPALNRIYAISAFVFGWIIFRAESVSHIGTILSTMFGGNGAGNMLELAKNGLVNPMQILMIIVGIICSMPVSVKLKKILERNEKTVYIIDAASVIALVLCVITLAQGAYNPFIYLRF